MGGKVTKGATVDGTPAYTAHRGGTQYDMFIKDVGSDMVEFVRYGSNPASVTRFYVPRELLVEYAGDALGTSFGELLKKMLGGTS